MDEDEIQEHFARIEAAASEYAEQRAREIEREQRQARLISIRNTLDDLMRMQQIDNRSYLDEIWERIYEQNNVEEIDFSTPEWNDFNI